ncbi:hypothetical protein EDC01DRAFT_303912 [Geopyxis carbonaria]|nr:hypothetical protein EDC01DRAFT_303912 [Geopyxis carbonaria]
MLLRCALLHHRARDHARCAPKGWQYLWGRKVQLGLFLFGQAGCWASIPQKIFRRRATVFQRDGDVTFCKVDGRSSTVQAGDHPTRRCIADGTLRFTTLQGNKKIQTLECWKGSAPVDCTVGRPPVRTLRLSFFLRVCCTCYTWTSHRSGWIRWYWVYGQGLKVYGVCVE